MGGRAVATLYVRDVPNDLYERLKDRAAQEGRSISQETVRLLRIALLTERAKPDPDFMAVKFGNVLRKLVVRKQPRETEAR